MNLLASRLPLLLGPALLLGAWLPIPGEMRAVCALLGVFLAWPAALWPYWRPIRRPGRDGERGGHVVRLLLGWASLGMLPILALLAAGWLGLSLGSLVSLWCGGLAVAILVAFKSPVPAGEPEPRRVRPLTALAVVLGLAILVLWVRSQGAPLDPLDDAYDHVATIRHMVISDRVELPGAFHARDVPAGWDPRKGALHLALAIATRLARVDTVQLWSGAPAVLAGLSGLVYLGFAFALLRRGALAVLALLFVLLLSPDPGRFVRGAYGGHWGLVLAWAGIGLALTGGGMLWGLVCGAACASVHAFAPAQLLVPLLGLALFRERSAGAVAPDVRAFVIGALAGALPIEAARLVISAAGGNPLHGRFMPELLLAWGAVASPLEIVRAWSIPGVAVALALLGTARFLPTRTARTLLTALFGPLLVLALPGVFDLVGRHLGSVANKLLVVWEPGVAIIAVLTLPFVAWRRSSRWSRAVMIAAASGVAASVAVGLPGRLAVLGGTRGGGVPPDIARSAEIIARHTPPDAVIATDAVTAYALPALTGRRTIVTLHQHAPPGDARAPVRIAVTEALFAPCIALEEALALARREGATHLLIGPPPARRIDQYANHVDPRSRPGLEARFSDPPELERLAESGGVRLFALRPGPVAAEGWAPVARMPTGSPPPEARVVTVREGSVHLTVPIPPDSLVWSRGDRVKLPASWRRDPVQIAAYEEIFCHIRFENATIPGWTGLAGVFSKPLRRLYLEKRLGGSLRWRAVEMPFLGRCPVANWPDGQSLIDTLDFVVPGNLLPGRYRLRLSLETGTLYPVLTPADLMSDEDRFSGPTLAIAEIR